MIRLEVPGAGVETLVRPDGYVAWAGDNRGGLHAALARWGAGTAYAGTNVR